MQISPPTIVLTDDQLREAERIWRKCVDEALDASELADEIDFWSRLRALWQGDLEAEDFTDHDATTLANTIATVDAKLTDLTRQAERHARAMNLPGYPNSRPHEDRTARFHAAKWADVVDLVQTVTAQPAIKRGRLHLFRCPFHDGDRSPSLTVYEPPRGWYCFGCQRGGDAVAFAAEFFRCGVVEALEMVEHLTDTYPASWSAA